jgi:plastocyanin
MPLALAIAIAGCTPGAVAPPSNGGQVASAVTVKVSLINYPDMGSPYGMIGGYSPALVVVARGTVIQFQNQDGFNHTASSVAGSSFPGGAPIPFSAQTPSGTDVRQAGWSTGTLTSGAFSRPFATSTVGQYLFGCYFHYPSGMRGVIVVQ